MFERLTNNARLAILDAVQTAANLGADKAGPEHLMMALANVGGSGARVLQSYGVTAEMLSTCLASTERRAGLTDDEVAALRAVGIDAEEVFRRIEADFGPEALVEPDRPQARRRGLLGGPFSRDARKVLELSLREAIALGQRRQVGTEHLLLALIRRGLPDPMATSLTEQGVTYDDARRRILAESRKAA